MKRTPGTGRSRYREHPVAAAARDRTTGTGGGAARKTPGARRGAVGRAHGADDSGAHGTDGETLADESPETSETNCWGTVTGESPGTLRDERTVEPSKGGRRDPVGTVGRGAGMDGALEGGHLKDVEGGAAGRGGGGGGGTGPAGAWITGAPRPMEYPPGGARASVKSR